MESNTKMDAVGRILIIDDDPAARKSLESVLIGEGYAISMSASGPEGLALAAEICPDLVLLDVMMPAMNGFEVCRLMRSAPTLAEVPILMISALEDREYRLQGIDAGADDFIPRPFDREELRARVRTIMRLNRYRKLRDEHEQLEAAHQTLLQTYDTTIEAWIGLVDMRDKETEGHTQRVMRMTVEIARRMGINGEALAHVRRGALLHDIGKLGIPDAVLLKPGKLTLEEWELIKHHPTHAFEWMRHIEYLAPALDIPYCHHERWDGAGYPRGLKGEDIPLPARCFAVADVWDALRSERPYKPAWSAEQSLKYICDNSGTHFDPKVVMVFLSYLSSAGPA